MAVRKSGAGCKPRRRCTGGADDTHTSAAFGAVPLIPFNIPHDFRSNGNWFMHWALMVHMLAWPWHGTPATAACVLEPVPTSSGPLSFAIHRHRTASKLLVGCLCTWDSSEVAVAATLPITDIQTDTSASQLLDLVHLAEAPCGVSTVRPADLHLGQVKFVSPVTPHPSLSNDFSTCQPPLSPSKTRSPSTPLSPARRSLSALGGVPKRGPLVAIPQFYFPQPSVALGSGSGTLLEPASREFLQQVDSHYEASGVAVGLQPKAFVKMMQEVCDLPSMVAYTLFRRLSGCDTAMGGEAGVVPRDKLVKFWTERGLVVAQPAKRVFDCLRPDGQDHLVFQDFWPLLECVLRHHPGLEFLAETAEFQRKYAETVIHRIFYSLNKCGSGRLTLREFRSGDLVDALYALDRENDINKILKFFSYEHFYVIYCKFWELDTDHDFLLDKNDLAHYSNCALSYVIVDRIFEEAPRKFKAGTPPGKMCYEDFVWFILSEEDKSTDTALTYWFRCVDLDADSVIRPREMLFFYEEQLRRLEGWNQEPVQFEDLLCQLHDMLSPAQEGAFTLRDLKRTKPQSGLFFSSLFSLHKFVNFENRDPFAQRAEATEFAGLSDWDKFAKIEYFRLASEDDQQEQGGGEADV